VTVLSRVQLNPEIQTDNTAYVTDLVTRAQDFLTTYLMLPRFPELIQGTSTSAESATEDLTGLSTNTIGISVNGSGTQEVDLTLANCDTGTNTAAELQTQIQAVDMDQFDEVTVAFADTKYTITSGRYGESSSINMAFSEDDKHVAQAMKLTTEFGGTELTGSAADADMETLAVMVTESLYAKAGVEGLESGGIPDGVDFTEADLSPVMRRMINRKLRLWL
jgi:hypothetical protein